MVRGKSRDDDIVEVDMEGVEAGSGAFHIPEGEYPVKCVSAAKDESQSGNAMIVWVFEGTAGKAEGRRFRYYTTMTFESRWKLKGLLLALGVEVPNSSMRLKLSEMIDLECTAVVQDDEYEGRIRSKMSDALSLKEADEEDEDEEEDEKPAAKTKAKAKTKPKAPPKLAASEIQEMNEDELLEVVEKYDLEADLSKFKTLRRKANAVIGELEDRDLIEDEDEE